MGPVDNVEGDRKKQSGRCDIIVGLSFLSSEIISSRACEISSYDSQGISSKHFTDDAPTIDRVPMLSCPRTREGQLKQLVLVREMLVIAVWSDQSDQLFLL